MQRADRIVILSIALAFSAFFGHRTEGFVLHPFYGLGQGPFARSPYSTRSALARIRWTDDAAAWWALARSSAAAVGAV